MTHTVFCKKLGREELGLDFPPLPGNLGQKIYSSISKAAWQQWLSHQTMLINEYRLNMLDQDAKKFLIEEMDKFLFGAGSDKPPGFEPTE